MKWIIDTDPGIDDAAAIITAIRSGLDVIGITAVFGNSPLHHTLRNSLRLVELLDADVPVHGGAEQALLEPPHHALDVHGEDGFGNTFLPDPARRPAEGHAVDFLLESARRHPSQLSILALGPLTNLALAIAQDRSFCRAVHHIVLMGGTSDARGNTTAVAEFNVHADPEAAAIVFASGIPITMVPWETTLKAVLGPEMVDVLQSSDRPLARTFFQASRVLARLVQERLGLKGLVLCDLVAAAVALDPGIMTEKAHAHVAVETCGTIARGLTAVDYAGLSGRPPNATVCLGVDRRRVGELFLKALTD
ncbi:MAG: nucleoside hydrolase [Bacillota bacterium]